MTMKKGKFYVLYWFNGYALKTGLIDNIHGERVGFYRERTESGNFVWTSIHIETGYTIERSKNKDECIAKTIDFIPKLEQYEQYIKNGVENMQEFLKTVA